MPVKGHSRYSSFNRPIAVDQLLTFIYAEPKGWHQGARLAGGPLLGAWDRRFIIKSKDEARDKLAGIIAGKQLAQSNQ